MRIGLAESRSFATKWPGQLATRLLGSRPVTRVARLATRARLTVLAYHDVADAPTFARQLDVIQEYHRPVPGEEVAAAVHQKRKLPDGAIWLTFDDAHPGVFTHALPLLMERGVPATLFVCPGVVDTDRPYWWQVLEAALARGAGIAFEGRTWSDRSIITHLKRIPDDVRRDTVDHVARQLAELGHTVAVPQATSTALRTWLDAGLELGNHTWDHPCLDTCEDDQQHYQIVTADSWLREMLGHPARLFAYPNGNTASTSRRVLAELGYTVTALFDHRVSRTSGPEVSRLRVDANASVGRFAAIASGAHPAALAVARRIGATKDATGVGQ